MKLNVTDQQNVEYLASASSGTVFGGKKRVNLRARMLLIFSTGFGWGFLFGWGVYRSFIC